MDLRTRYNRCSQAACPTRSGLFWLQSELNLLAIMMEVYLKNGYLTVWWLNEEQPMAGLQGSWQSPIRPFGKPAN